MTVQELKKLRETEDKVEFKEAKRDFNFAGGSHRLSQRETNSPNTS